MAFVFSQGKKEGIDTIGGFSVREPAVEDCGGFGGINSILPLTTFYLYKNCAMFEVHVCKQDACKLGTLSPVSAAIATRH